MKKTVTVLCVLVAMLLSGCSLFDASYEVIEDYTPIVQETASESERIIVRNISSLKQAIRTLITNGATEGKILFDSAYEGDPNVDMSKACWQVRTQDALCAYCVENISFGLTKIVTYYEAQLSISYTEFAEQYGSIQHLPYSTGIEQLILDAILAGNTSLVILVDRSSYTAEEVENLASQVYRKYPSSAPREPFTSVNMFSGANMQRLYEINMRYGMTANELELRRSQLARKVPFSHAERLDPDETQRAYLAYSYIRRNCTIESKGTNSTVYNALIEHAADSEGIALAYVELCRQMNLECQIVYGQRDWTSHCWNIVQIDGDYYHVDAAYDGEERSRDSFLGKDESFWVRYRWDMSSYPACSGENQPDDYALGQEGMEIASVLESQEAMTEQEDPEEIFSHDPENTQDEPGQ